GEAGAGWTRRGGGGRARDAELGVFPGDFVCALPAATRSEGDERRSHGAAVGDGTPVAPVAAENDSGERRGRRSVGRDPGVSVVHADRVGPVGRPQAERERAVRLLLEKRLGARRARRETEGDGCYDSDSMEVPVHTLSP